MAKLWARPVHGVLILAKGGGAGPPWPYARSAPATGTVCDSFSQQHGQYAHSPIEQ